MRRLVRRYPRTCARAFAAQGGCKVRASGTWRCRSRIIGPAAKGAPSRQRCRRGRSRASFVVTYFPPTEPTFGPAARASANAYSEAGKCVKADTPATPVPTVAGTSFQVRLLQGVGMGAGTSLQQDLVNRSADARLSTGLGSKPRNDPGRVPLFLSPTKFDTAGDLGIAAPACPNLPFDGIVVRTNAPDFHSTAAHELFHAYSFWGITKGEVEVPWFEEAAATWAQGKLGFGEEAMYDYLLQFPQTLDSRFPGGYPYAMSRFLQYLDDKGLVDAGSDWPLIGEVSRGYKSPGATLALSSSLVSRGTSLGEQLAAFWGDRLRDKPIHGPQLKPGLNARQIEVKPGTEVISTTMGRLDTEYLDFTLADNVKRVEFEFHPPANGYFWGAPTEKTSQRFFEDETISFCVGGGDADDLEWPIRFPVTFTNGSLGEGNITGKVTVRAQSDPEQCTSPTTNRACKFLRIGGAPQILGPGQYPFYSSGSDEEMRYWLCFYVGSSGEVSLNLARFPQRTPRQVRRAVTRQIELLEFRRVTAGDLAGAGTQFDDEGKPFTALVMAVNREIAFFILGPGADQSRVIRLARRAAGGL